MQAPNLCAHMIYAHVLSAHVYMCVQECTHLTHMPVSCMLIPILSYEHMHMLHTYHKHTPYSSREKPSTPLLSTEVLFAVFKHGFQGSEKPTLLCMGAMYEASRERPQVKACKAANIQLIHMPL